MGLFDDLMLRAKVLGILFKGASSDKASFVVHATEAPDLAQNDVRSVLPGGKQSAHQTRALGTTDSAIPDYDFFD